MKSKHSTAFDIGITFLTKIVFLGGSFIISIILARLLGPEGKGVVTALFVVPNMVVSISDLGVRQASAYFVGQKKYSVQDVLSSSLVLWLGTSVLSMFSVAVYFLIPVTTKYSYSLVFIGIMYIPVKILISYFNGILQGQQKIANMNLKFIIEFSVRLILVITFVWFFNLDVFGAAVSKLVTSVAVLSYSFYIVQQTANVKFEYIPGIPKDLFNKGIVFAIALFVLQLNYKIDILFLQNMVSSYEVGLYSVGVTLAELIWQLPAAVGVVLFSRSVNSKSDSEASERSAKLLRLSWPPLIFVSAAFLLGAPLIIRILYGTDYIEAASVIRILLPGIVAMVLYKILNADLAGRGHPLFALKIYLFALIVNMILNYYLIPIYSLNGAALSSTISYMLGAILFSISYHKYTGISYRKLFILEKEDIEMLKKTARKWKSKG